MNRGLLITFGGLVALIIILLNYKMQLKDEVANNIETLRLIEKDGVLLNDLKNRWSNKKNEKRILRYIKNFSPYPTVKRRGNKIFFKFEGLNKSRFETLSRKILQSTIQISKFEIERIDDWTLNFKLEINK